MKTNLRTLIVALAASFAGTSGASAASIAWSSDVGSLLYQADGSTLDASFTFELGTFTAGFIPTEYNLADWAANWKLFDQAHAPNPNPDTNGEWNPVDQFFVGGADVNGSGQSTSPEASPSTIFNEGEQLYIWAFNSKTLDPQNTEWALITRTQPDPFTTPAYNDWLIPAQSVVDTQTLHLNEADLVVFGGLHNVDGPGTFDVGNKPASFQLQTHVVPEPSSALLIAAIGLMARLRRSRNR